MAGGGYDQIFSDFILATGENSKVMGQAINSANNTVDASLADSLKYLDNSYKEAQAYLTPFRVAGENSIQTLNNFIGVNGKAAQQQALSTIMQPAMNAMVDYGPQIAQQAMGMFFGSAGIPQQQANQILNQSTATAIQSKFDLYKPENIQTQIDSLQQQIKNAPNNTIGKQEAMYAQKQLGDLQQQQQAYQYMQETGKPYNGYNQSDVQAIQNGQAPVSAINQSIGSSSNIGGMFDQYLSQYDRLMNSSPEALSQSLIGSSLNQPGMGQYNDLRNTSAADFSNNLMGSLLDPVTGQVTRATQGFTDSMMKYGVKAIDQSAASKGMLNSGRTIAEAQDYGMGVAGQYIIPAMQNVLNMGMQAGTNQANQIMQAGNAQLTTGVNAGMNQAGNIMQSGTNLLNQQNQSQTSLANQYMGSMLGGGAQLGSQSIGSTQSALSNLLAQATGASTTGAGLAGQQGTTGSGYNMQVGQYKADNALLNGKVQMDALNTMSQLQFLQDMGPYVNQLGAIPGISAGGGGGGSNAAAQHNAVDSQAQNYLRSGGGSNGLYKGPGYNTGAGQNFGWVNPGPQGQTVNGGWGATYTPG